MSEIRGYQIRYWKHSAGDLGGVCWVNSPGALPQRIAELVKEKPIRLEIVADDTRGNVVVGDNGVNGPGWRT